MRNFIKFIIILNFVFKIQILFCGGGELWISNNTSTEVRIHVYTISMIFNKYKN